MRAATKRQTISSPDAAVPTSTGTTDATSVFGLAASTQALSKVSSLGTTRELVEPRLAFL